LDEFLDVVVAGKPDEVSDALFFAKLVEIRTCKGYIPTEPKALEPRRVALNQWRDKVHQAFG